ncbi:amino acid ABC transporter permease [uncultured Clostridium sp.]|jgi:polar amino acid transport system permease protein|uniref:amino acid ABC transporter permease n=1 Tax=uncultured Clostridium sp. TaxID=59620 RepID=UPI002621CCDF|nr:amino acid ABC transporter permease [uncultured Clostridium sp.]
MDYVGSLLPQMLEGLVVTLKVFIVTLLFSVPLGMGVALCRISHIKIIKSISGIYVWVMRGTPLLLQLVVIFFGLPLVDINLDRFPAAILAFILNYAAYFGEIFRAGILDVDNGQIEASEILGFSKAHTLLRIVMPQMIKKVFPAIANEVITLVKDTSLVYVVGLGELLRAGKIASNRDASLVPLLLVGAIYLIVIAILTLIFNKLEKKYSYYN